jgi:hypothetical protein
MTGGSHYIPNYGDDWGLKLWMRFKSGWYIIQVAT